jgi:hypothetical protein
VRIATGSLVPDVAIRETGRAKVVLLWTGRLTRLPGYHEWARAHGVQALSMPAPGGPERGLYRVRPVRAMAVPGSLAED